MANENNNNLLADVAVAVVVAAAAVVEFVDAVVVVVVVRMVAETSRMDKWIPCSMYLDCQMTSHFLHHHPLR